MRRVHFCGGLAYLLGGVLLCFAQDSPQQLTTQQSTDPTAQRTAPKDGLPNAPSAQANPPNGQQSSSGQQSQGTDARNSPDQPKTENGTSKDRLFFALPNFLTLENAGLVPPLTTGEKFKVVARGSFDYVQFPWYGFLAGISQAENSEAGYGQGAEGYAKRYGASWADGTIENFMTGAILPSILRQDPRYFQNGHGGFWSRTEYAISRIFVTRTDSGNHTFNASEVVGSAISSAISTYSYHPREDRNLVNTASVWGTQVGYDTLTLVVKEFWPDIRRKIKKEPKPVQ